MRTVLMNQFKKLPRVQEMLQQQRESAELDPALVPTAENRTANRYLDLTADLDQTTERGQIADVSPPCKYLDLAADLDSTAERDHENWTSYRYLDLTADLDPHVDLNPDSYRDQTADNQTTDLVSGRQLNQETELAEPQSSIDVTPFPAAATERCTDPIRWPEHVDHNTKNRTQKLSCFLMEDAWIRNNCSLRGRCSNSVYECKGIALMVTESGLGVRVTTFIPVGSVIGEYMGTLITHDYEKDEETTSEYAMKLQTRSVTKKVAYIDADECGGMARFINHSCAAKCAFVEIRNRRQVKVMVLVKNSIMIGEEVTVDSGDDLWFSCTCGHRDCCCLVTAWSSNWAIGVYRSCTPRRVEHARIPGYLDLV
ncbi:hypothetical protein BBJ28_00023830 [Nothophytophthora sp. Chile5]|nr:hypothetical protein BBJ28_00023830 [Nothophytophthora sp. Chile5]